MNTRTPTPATRRKRRRSNKRTKADTRWTIRQFATEVQSADGPRLDLAFFSLPLWKGGAR